VSLSTPMDRGCTRVELERVIAALCHEYGASVKFDAPRTEHYPDRIDTVLVWNLDKGNCVILEYWMFNSSLLNDWNCNLMLDHCSRPITLPRRQLDCGD
jgi:hypothetical protein